MTWDVFHKMYLWLSKFRHWFKKQTKEKYVNLFCGVSSEGKIGTFLPWQKWPTFGNFKHMVYDRGKSKNSLKDLAIKIGCHQYVIYLGRNTMINVVLRTQRFPFSWGWVNRLSEVCKRLSIFWGGGVQFITPAGPRQSLLLAKDLDQFLWKPYIP